MATDALSGDVPGLHVRGRAGTSGAVRLGAAWSVVSLSVIAWMFLMAAQYPADPWGLLPWMLAYASALVVAGAVLVRMPHHPLALWLALGTLVCVFEVAVWALRQALTAPAPIATVALCNFAAQLLYLVPGVAVARVLGLFADGIVRRRYERVVLDALWIVLLVPVVLLVCSPTVVIAFYIGADAPVVNPFANPLFALDPAVGAVVQEVAGPSAVVVGAVVLVLRYGRAAESARRPMRWLLLPTALLPVILVSQALLVGPEDVFVSLMWASVMIGFAAAIGFGMLQPAGFSADRVVRRTIAYGVLWTAIAVAFVIVAATVGTAADAFLPVGWAVAIATFAAVVFQPIRTRLERLADRWVFGARTDPAQLVVGLGESLAATYDLDALLPRMRATLEDGMGLRWARVRLLSRDGTADLSDPARVPDLEVPIEVDGERVGVIECGPKLTGRLSAEDAAILETFARQAGMAVRNVRLKEELAAQAALLQRSRARLVRAQEQERRRIERNIHDGVQQDLTALIGLVGQARRDRVVDSIDEDLTTIQEGLRRVLADLRDFAQGIHPSVLSDRGLLAALETLGGRHPVPVTVRAGSALRDQRLPDEIEGAAYFTVAEALANTLKHADAHRIDVELELGGGILSVRAHDDGCGFDPEGAGGSGLTNLRERVVAVGGTLEVDSRPGEGTTVAAEFPVAGGG